MHRPTRVVTLLLVLALLSGLSTAASTASIGKINAVWQYEDLFSDGRFRVKVIVPTTSSNPLKMSRVDGAGVSAVIDMALSQQEELQAAKEREERERAAALRSRPVIVVPNPVPHDRGKHKGWTQGERKGQKK